MAGLNAVSGGGERACCNCGKPGHLHADSSELHIEVRNYLKTQAAARGRGRGRGRGRWRGGPGGAISVAEVQNMVDSLSGAESVFIPDKWLIDSGSDTNICYNYGLLLYIGLADIDKCTLVQWSDDVIKAHPFFGRSRVRFRVPPWVSNTIARDHLA